MTPEQMAEAWNAQFPPGTPVRYWPGARSGEGRVSQTRSAAWVVGGHTAVVAVDGWPGGINLTHVEPITEGAPQ